MSFVLDIRGSGSLLSKLSKEIKQMDVQAWSSGEVWNRKPPFGIYQHMHSI